MVSTVDRIDREYGHVLDSIERASVIIFSVEFLTRLWCCVEDKKYKRRGPFWGMLLW